MSNQDIRLRLVVRRHAVPEVKLVWPCPVTDDTTIAKLLSMVNEVIPLESGEWGLEDYVVELADSKGGSFECLHFQPVRRILKEDDQVIIRSLLTDDLKRRRLSGRHQISGNGQHLVDGLPFGRPWLRTPRDRPVLELPPRKRARILYNAEEEVEEIEEEQLLLEAPPSLQQLEAGIDADFEDEDEEDDDDFDPDSETFGREDIESESESESEADFDSSEDESSDEGGVAMDTVALSERGNGKVDDITKSEDERMNREIERLLVEYEKKQNKTTSRGSADPEKAPASASEDLAALIQTAFPLTPLAAIQIELHRCSNDLEKTYNALVLSNDPSLPLSSVKQLAEVLDSDDSSEADENDEAEDDDFNGCESPARRPLIVEVESNDEPASPKATAKPSRRATMSKLVQVEAAEDEDSSSSEFEESSSDEDDDSSSEDEDDAGNAGNNKDKDEEDDDESSGGDYASTKEVLDDGDRLPQGSSSSRSSGADRSDGTINPRTKSWRRYEAEQPDSSSSDGSSDSSMADSSDSSSDGSSSSSSEDDESDSLSEPEEMPATSKSAANKTSKTPTKLLIREVAVVESQPPAPAPQAPTTIPGQGLSKTQKRNARRRDLKRLRRLETESSQGSPAEKDAAAGQQELEKRKEALLARTEVSSPVNQRQASQTAQKDDRHEDALTTASVEPARQATSAETPTGGQQAESSSPKEDSAKKRMRLDMGAGKRLLFGALGLKAPKSKSDEAKLKESLMKDVRPLQNKRIADAKVREAQEEDDDERDKSNPDWWKEKINYRAVECCYDDMTLSEPPFPFVQRWDPQQQFGSLRKRKRKQSDNYDNYDDGTEYAYSSPAQQQNRNGRTTKRRKSELATEIENPASNDATAGTEQGNTKAWQETSSHFTDVEDLPSLPLDLTSLPLLQFDGVKLGMVITWKELQMSKATGWQPQMISVTGLVLPGGSEATLRILLATRDREKDEKQYDEATGQRIYDKFEVPDMDEDENEAAVDDGYRDVAWADMIEPRLVQEAPPASMLNGTAKDDLLVQKDIHHESGHSASIQSGQGALLHTAGEAFVNISNDSLDMERSNETGETTHSPLRQSEEASRAVSVNGTNGSHQQQHPHALSHDSVSQSVEQESELVDLGLSAMNSKAVRNDSQASNAEAVSGSVHYPKLTVPMSQASIHSGRQPDDKLDAIQDSMEPSESVIPETVPAVNGAALVTPENPRASRPSSSGSSPFPSLEEIFHTAATARQTQSPRKSTQESIQPHHRSQPAPDLEYEEAMRRLDDDDDEDTVGRNKSIRNLFPNATQPAASTKTPPTYSPGERRSKRSAVLAKAKQAEVISIGSSPTSVKGAETSANSGTNKVHEEPGPTTRSHGKSLSPSLSASSVIKNRGRKKSNGLKL